MKYSAATHLWIVLCVDAVEKVFMIKYRAESLRSEEQLFMIFRSLMEPKVQ